MQNGQSHDFLTRTIVFFRGKDDFGSFWIGSVLMVKREGVCPSPLAAGANPTGDQ